MAGVPTRSPRDRQMRRPSFAPLLLTAALTTSASGAGAPAPAAKPGLEPPRLRFVGIGPDNAGTGHIMLRFEASNPNAAPLPYVGYRANAFTPPLKEGTMAPLYKLEYRKGK